jgi:acyl-homoserine lactone acylase PvdQ
VLFGRLVAHLSTPDPAEAVAALSAVLDRMKPDEVQAVVGALAALLPERRHADVLVGRVIQALHRWSPEAHRALGRALVDRLRADRLAGALTLRVGARISEELPFAVLLEELSAAGHLHHDAIGAAIGELRQFGRPDALSARLADSADPRLRRVALAALSIAAAPENGWTDGRRTMLARLQADPHVDVAAPAAWVFPP